MRRTCWFPLLLALVLTLAPAFAAGDPDDDPGSKDHPLFTRMPGFYIDDYEEKEFDSHEFLDTTGRASTVEGHKYTITYCIKPGQKAPSETEVLRNYTNAVKKIGGIVLAQSGLKAYMKVVKNGQEVWVDLRVFNRGESYTLIVVEKAGMEQKVTADAAWMLGQIDAAGKVAVYGIYFDTGKAVPKPESGPVLQEIAKLLQANPGLKLHVVGHTDNVGDQAMNMKLSADRANAVMMELINKHKIAAARLKASGVGPLCPVASNKTEEGRAKNRRVELVEQ